MRLSLQQKHLFYLYLYPLKRITSILLFFIFCVYTFTFKTHYCYYADTGKRFHGDCHEHLHGLKADKNSNEALVFGVKYSCIDIQKEFQYKQTESSYKFPSFEIELPGIYTAKTVATFYPNHNWNIKEIPIRAGPNISSNSLRAPPSC